LAAALGNSDRGKLHANYCFHCLSFNRFDSDAAGALQKSFDLHILVGFDMDTQFKSALFPIDQRRKSMIKRLLWGALVAGYSYGAKAVAQHYPDKPVRIITVGSDHAMPRVRPPYCHSKCLTPSPASRSCMCPTSPVGKGSAEFATDLKRDIDRYVKVARDSNIRSE